MPSSVKLAGNVTKRIFKDAMRPWLPDRIIDREKMGFGVPVANWFRGPLKDLLRDVLLDPHTLNRGMFRPERVEALIASHVAGSEENSRKLWTLLQLELWQRTFLDPRHPTQTVL